MGFIPTNWRSSLAGLLILAGIGLEAAGQYEIGKGLQAAGALFLGQSASDKAVSKQAVLEVKEQVQEVKQDVNVVKQDVRDVKQDVKDVVTP